jgi:glycerol-3-phosphate dehydrogenase (NAD(P)+)
MRGMGLTNMTLAIIGAGSWGTALSIVLAPKFDRIRLWVHEPDLASRMNATRENDVYLPGFPLPSNVDVLTDLAQAVTRADLVMGVMPSRHARSLYTSMLPYLDDSITLVSATKGIESGTLLRMSDVVAEVTRAKRVAVLSGPTFAKEVARGEPAAVVVASSDPETASRVQTAFSGPTLRLYTNRDPIGVEIGAALKNVIAIGAGVCAGLKFGNNTQAALITRGLAEIARLAVAMGGKPETLAGLAGLGDLVLTCNGDLSRNRNVGLQLANGRTIKDIVASMSMVAEGVETCGAAIGLGAKFNVDLPIIQQMHAVLQDGKSPRQALKDLMERTLKSE